MNKTLEEKAQELKEKAQEVESYDELTPKELVALYSSGNYDPSKHHCAELSYELTPTEARIKKDLISKGQGYIPVRSVEETIIEIMKLTEYPEDVKDIVWHTSCITGKDCAVVRYKLQPGEEKREQVHLSVGEIPQYDRTLFLNTLLKLKRTVNFSDNYNDK